MKYEIKVSCGHTVTVDIYGSAAERERKVKWYENNYICDECRDAENAKDCEEVEMSYSEYKTNYSDCNTKKDSYNKKTKTIIVYVPVAEEPEETNDAEETAVAEIASLIAENSPRSISKRIEAAHKILNDTKDPEKIALWRKQVASREPSESTTAMSKALDIAENYWKAKGTTETL